jgi:diacylglycerol kinase
LRQRASRETPPPGRGGLLQSFRYAWQGIAHVMRTQRNARIHAAIGALALLSAVILRLSPAELAAILICVFAVFAAEMMNTVVESFVDLVTAEYHPLAKVAKDVAAGAVLVTACGAALVGLLVIGPHLWHLLT